MLRLLIYRYIHKKDDELLPFIKRLVLEFCVGVNARDSKAYAPLHFSCKRLQFGVTCIKLLLKIYANVNFENDKGENVLTVSAVNQEGKKISDYIILCYYSNSKNDK